MKKKLILMDLGFNNAYIRKILTVMRITVLLCVLGVMQVAAANSYSQEARISLEVRETAVSDVLREIEEKSEFFFLYNNKLIDVDRVVDVDVKNKSITKVLDLLFADNVQRNISDRQIVLSPAIQQDETLRKGIVLSADDGLGLPGVSVVIKGTTTGTSTDIDGAFSIKANEGDILIFSFMGMVTQEFKVVNIESIQIQLKSDALQVDEVMVVAYGTAKKSTFTGSVAGVSEEKMEKIQASDPAKALAGNVAGVRVVSTSGAPGSSASIRIRGIGSINASSSPLIIVDGAPYSGSLNSISTSDIKSMNVLKDAASAALYGARGANGVVIITTKSAKKGSNIKFEAKVGMNYRSDNQYDVMRSPSQYYETYWDAVRNRNVANGASPSDAAIAASSSGDNGLYHELGYNIYNVANDQIVRPDGTINPDAQIIYKDKGWNDWEKELYNPEMRQEYNLSMSKVVDKSKLYFSLGYLKDEGYTPNSGFERVNSKLSFDTDVTDWLTLKVSNLFSTTESSFVSSGTGTYSNSFGWMNSIAPIYPIYRHDATGAIETDLRGNKVYDFGQAQPNVNGVRAYGANANPAAVIAVNIDDYKSYYLTNNVALNLKFSESLSFSTTATLYNEWYENDDFNDPITGVGKTNNGLGGKERGRTSSLNLNQILRWNKEFEGFSLNVMLGHESYDQDMIYLYGQKANYLDPNNIEFGNAAVMLDLDSSTRGYNLEGYFGQVTFDFADKYYLSGSYRRDGSSIFHPDNRWGDFFSVGASWRLKEENFLQGADYLDNLKLRASYGTQGNDYLYLPGSTRYRAYTPYKSLINITNDGTTFGTQKKYLGNKEVTWEKNKNFNIGVDFSIFNGVLSGELEFFHKKTNDLLFNLPVPQSTGYSSVPTNIGDMKNTGYEVALNSQIIKSDDFSWDLGVNFSYFKNEITKLPDVFAETGIIRGYQTLKVGGGIYDFWMVEYAGVDETNGDALFNMYNKTTEKFEITSDPDPEVYDDSKSRKLVGSAVPDLTGGFSTSLGYKNFDLSMQFAFQLGGKASDGVYQSLMGTGEGGANWHNDINDRWTPANTKTNIPRVEVNYRTASYTSDRFLTDASYLAFNNLTLGYTFPKHMTQRLNISKLRVYFVADNIALWSKRKGFDPRMEFSGIISNGRYAPIKTASFGLVVNL